MPEATLDTPVAFILFRRPDTTRRVWERIRAARPRRLFLIADGGRNEPEWEACRAAREVVVEVDWPCEVSRDFADENLGCRERVLSGLDAVFAQVEEAIILEDDCLPDPSFFRFCEELLARYRDDERVMTVSGDNFQGGRTHGTASYYFTCYAPIWGWATWRRAWRRLDKGMVGWPAFRDGGGPARAFADRDAAALWTAILDRAHAGEWAWDHRWWFSQLAHEGVGICPQRNLVENIGFDEGATHTGSGSRSFPTPEASAQEFPLHHPPEVAVSREADRHFFTSAIAPPPDAEGARPAPPGLGRVVAWLRGQDWYKSLRNPAYRRQRAELDRLASQSETMGGTSDLIEPGVDYVGGPALARQYEAIFVRERYHFHTTEPAPVIIDGGAHAGLAALYWKRLFPGARIICYEPDSGALRCLRANVERHRLDDVAIHGAALADEDGDATFERRGGDRGRLLGDAPPSAPVETVPRVRLRPLLDRPVDLLKLSVGDAERAILRDCADALGPVRRLAVAYHGFKDRPQELAELLGILERAGYRLRVENDERVPRPLSHRQSPDGLDLKLQLFAWRP